jgi:hypothetical protein
MHLSLRRNVSRLPKRFPIGATYVVEGRGGEDGNFRVFSRYVVLPDGQRINLGADNQKSAVAVPSRARRPRSRQAAAAQRAAKRRSSRPKKISENGGTPRRHRR